MPPRKTGRAESQPLEYLTHSDFQRTGDSVQGVDPRRNRPILNLKEIASGVSKGSVGNK